MAFTVAAVKTAYDALGVLAATTAAAYATLIGLGTRPAMPVDVVADADYTTPLAAQVTYDAAWLAASVAYNTAVGAQKVSELAVVAVLPAGQWVKLTTLANWGAVATQYVSQPFVQKTSPNSCPLFILNALTTLPALAYPSFN